MSQTIEQTLRALLSNIRDGIDFTDASVDADFGAIGLDSLDTASFLMEVQENFGVTISDEAAEGLTTIALVVAFIEANK